MKKFEFFMVPQPTGLNVDQIQKMLNHLGEAGWSLAGMDYGYFIMQREKSND